MADLNKYTDKTWERFFEFIHPCEESLSRDEVRVDLKRLGIEVGKAVGRVKQALAATKGRAELAEAKSKRPGVVARLRQMAAVEVGGDLRERLKKIISGTTRGEVQLAYYRKLESAATDDDLQSLLDDIHRLGALSEEAAADEPRTE